MRAFGVTGTNGKTTTSVFLNAILGAWHSPSVAVTTVGFYRDSALQTQALSAPAMDAWLARGQAEGGKTCVFELSSEALARGFLSAYPVQIGIFTNLSHDHLDAHQSPEHYLAAKAQLFTQLPQGGIAVFNSADPCSELLREVLPTGVRVFDYGVASRGPGAASALVRTRNVHVTRTGTRLELEPHALLESVTELEVPAIGEIFAENALAALTAALAAGVPMQVAKAALATAPVPPGRFEIVAHEPLVAVDFAHTPDGLSRTLTTARQLVGPKGRVFVVFGAGGERDRQKRPLLGQAATSADVVILTSDNPRSEDPAAIASAIAAGLGEHTDVSTLLDRRAAIARALQRANTEDVVVVAGKGHEATQISAQGRAVFSDAAVVRELLGR